MALLSVLLHHLRHHVEREGRVQIEQRKEDERPVDRGRRLVFNFEEHREREEGDQQPDEQNDLLEVHRGAFPRCGSERTFWLICFDNLLHILQDDEELPENELLVFDFRFEHFETFEIISTQIVF